MSNARPHIPESAHGEQQRAARQPSEFVSEKLISGILGANGLIFIGSPVSNSSFWTAFERDFAVRKQKKMLRFDPETKTLARYEVRPRSRPPLPSR